MNRRQKRYELKKNKLAQHFNYTSNISEQAFKDFATRSLKGELSQDEWSRMTPALRKKLERFTKRMRKVILDPEFLKSLPEGAIIKDIKMNDDKTEELAPSTASN